MLSGTEIVEDGDRLGRSAVTILRSRRTALMVSCKADEPADKLMRVGTPLVQTESGTRGAGEKSIELRSELGHLHDDRRPGCTAG